MLEIWICSSGSNYLHPATRGLYWCQGMLFSLTDQGGRMVDTYRRGRPVHLIVKFSLSKCSLKVTEVRQKYLYKYSPFQVHPHTYPPEGTSHPFGVVFPDFSPISQSFATAEESILLSTSGHLFFPDKWSIKCTTHSSAPRTIFSHGCPSCQSMRGTAIQLQSTSD